MAKARKQKLKVFRTPIGFHDAYVAAPSRKAALEAWGAGTDLFSAGISQEVKEDSEPAREALARPGEVVRAKREGGEEDAPSPRSASRSRPLPRGEMEERKPKPKAKPKPKPRPSRAALDKAEKDLASLEEKQAAEQAELDKEEVRLANRRRALEKKQREAMEKAEGKRDEAERNYRKAMKEWAG